jgi:hypothetical protein
MFATIVALLAKIVISFEEHVVLSIFVLHSPPKTQKMVRITFFTIHQYLMNYLSQAKNCCNYWTCDWRNCPQERDWKKWKKKPNPN